MSCKLFKLALHKTLEVANSYVVPPMPLFAELKIPPSSLARILSFILASGVFFLFFTDPSFWSPFKTEQPIVKIRIKVPKKAYFVKFFIIIFFVAKIQHNLI